MYSHVLLAMMALTTTHVLTLPMKEDRIPERYNQDLSQETPTPIDEDNLYDYMTGDDEEEEHFRRRLYDTLAPTVPSRDPLAE